MSFMTNMNEVFIAGRLGKEPEEFGNGKVVSFSIANNRRYKNPSKGGTWDSATNWVTVKAFGYLVPEILRYHKGDLVIIHGALREETWESGGRKSSKLIVVADSIALVNSRKKDEEEIPPEPEGWPDEGGMIPDDSDVPF